MNEREASDKTKYKKEEYKKQEQGQVTYEERGSAV